MTYLIKYNTREELVEAATIRDAGSLAEKRKRQGERLVGVHERPDLRGVFHRVLMANGPDLMHKKERHG